MKKIVIIFGILILVLGGVLLFMVIKKPQNKSSTLTTKAKTSTLEIADTSPKNNQQNVQTKILVAVTFNKSFSLPDFQISIAPSTEYTISNFENVLFVQPKTELNVNTTYSIVITNKTMASPYAFSFTTSPTRSEGGFGPDPKAILEIEEGLRKVDPAAYLSNHLPHSEPSFSMDYFLNKQTGHFSFTVAMKGPDIQKSRIDSISFMHSLRLTDDQIQTLDIEYLADAVVKLRDKLPYFGKYFTIGYKSETSQITAIILQDSKALGEKELDDFLAANGITSRSQVPNLVVHYQ